MVLKYFIYDVLKNIDVNFEKKEENVPLCYKSLGIIGGLLVIYPHIVKSFDLYEIKRCEYNNSIFTGTLFTGLFSYYNSFKSLFYLSTLFGSISFIGGFENILIKDKRND